MVAALEVDLRLVPQAVIHDDAKPIGGTKWRHGARLAIDEKSLDLLLVCHIHMTSKQLAEFAEFDVTRCGQYREQKPVSSLEHDRLGKAIRR
jgi:hypothetical protein